MAGLAFAFGVEFLVKRLNVFFFNGILLFLFLCRIFVNRSLHLENIKFYGFDMDYTLAGRVLCKIIKIPPD